MKINLLIACIMTVTLASCSKNKTGKAPDVYIDASDINGNQVYYKNGIANMLSGGANVTGPLFVEGSDMYYPISNGYLKNGTAIYLQDAGHISSVFVKNGQVYATGMNSSGGPAYWKNGLLVQLPDSAAPLKIVVAGTNDDIYLGGGLTGDFRYSDIAYWHNGVWHRLEEGTFRGMAVSSSGVHVIGMFSTDRAGYWLNGVEQTLVDAENQMPAYMTSVSVWNDDVYITAANNGDCLYWKNGQPVGQVSGIKQGGVAVAGGEVQVLGNIENKIVLYRNGGVDTIGTGFAKGICLGN